MMRSIFALAGLYCMTHAQAADWQQPQYIENAFIEIALQSEYQTGRQAIRKWQQPIVYQQIYQQVSPYAPLDEMVEIHLNHLQKITGHPIRKQNNSQQANLKIIISRDQHYQQMIDQYAPNPVKQLHIKSNCMAQIRSAPNGEIQQATVIIPVDHVVSKGLLPACIAEELTQIMGLPNDSDWVNPSIANDKSVTELLSGLDYVFLKLLYLPQIEPGMDEATTRKIIREQIQRFSEAGVVRNAQRYVNSDGLYHYIHY